MWQILLCVGFIFLILEMFTPAMFFLNFAIAAFVCAGLSVYINSITVLVIVFSLLSIVLIFTLRPILMKNMKGKENETGMSSKYVGKIAKVIEDVDKKHGVVSIYDERWQARNIEDYKIDIGREVEITGFDSLILYVKEVK